MTSKPHSGRCKDCGRAPPEIAFARRKSHDEYIPRTRCYECYAAYRRGRMAMYRAKKRALRAPPVPRTTKHCRRCDLELPLEAFYNQTNLCKVCNNVVRKERRLAKRSQGISIWKLEGSKRRYECRVCHVAQVSDKNGRCHPCAMAMLRASRPSHPCVDCGAPLYEKQDRCITCKQARLGKFAEEGNERQRQRYTAKMKKLLADGKVLGLLWISPDEAWRLDRRCGRCKKPVFAGGSGGASLCYTCATGRPRTVLRWDEREAVTA